MANPKFSFCFLFVVVSYSILIPNCCLGVICSPKQHAALFVFGDSLFDVGNNNYINTTADNQANYSPYGETFFKYPSGRFSDGRVIPDFIAEYAKLPLIQPYLFPGNQRYVDGVNFASAGAGALVETHQGLVIDLKTQLSYFEKVSEVLRQELGDAETTTLLAKAVYLINIGSNDYEIILSGNTSTYTAEKFVDTVVGNITTVIKGIHKTGGRKFGVLNQPAVGCIPLIKALVNGSKDVCVEEASALAKLHNSVLSVELDKLNKELKGFKYSYVDYFNLSFDVINNPLKYGFKEGDVACCGSGSYRGYYSCGGKRVVKDYELCENPSEYVFFDSVHPTERVHQIVSQLIWSGNQSITGPYNLKTLFEE
ncbi:GDSL esterase/lipase 5 [Cajanus cajan]|uniref:GDSL esterase/lipase 5 n=1 Tax=Cajanus cajan TaxID=3821 RepID=A0A151TYB7_CAJCA|nr:GDSL esterase/lipase 5 [Cajanus cajan]KYP72036.1 GDSL esterase/lipase 5 [Cajanus cajan]